MKKKVIIIAILLLLLTIMASYYFNYSAITQPVKLRNPFEYGDIDNN